MNIFILDAVFPIPLMLKDFYVPDHTNIISQPLLADTHWKIP